MKKLILSLFSIFKTLRQTDTIKKTDILWNAKPFKENSVLLWDLENIPFHRLDDIKRVVKYTPDELYIITKQKLGKTLLKNIHQEGFKTLTSHKTISDDKIIAMMRLFKNRKDMILVSSDSDFAREANQYLKKHKLQWIVVENVKKAVVMKANLANTNLTLSVIESKKSKKSHVQNNASNAKIKNKYNFLVYYQYYRGKVRERLNRIKNLFSSIQLQQKNLQEQSALSKVETVQKEEIKSVYRQNYKGRKVVCGKLCFYESKIKLTLQKKLLRKYDIPNFKHSIEFKNMSEVKRLIHFNQNKNEYYLNKFKRLEDTFL
jgi:predicted nuclease of predicted toxin-antitoxin system